MPFELPGATAGSLRQIAPASLLCGIAPHFAELEKTQSVFETGNGTRGLAFAADGSNEIGFYADGLAVLRGNGERLE
jgi:hypothetical protein